MAFNRAEVVSGARVMVSATSTSRLSVLRVDTALGSYPNGGYLQLTFPSQPPGSTYTYNNVFQVLNRATAPITFRVLSVTGEGAPLGAHITITDAATTAVYWQNGTSVSSKTLTAYAAGAGCPCAVNLNVSITLDSGVPVGTPVILAITVEGQY
jgi:hypothetical protein